MKRKRKGAGRQSWTNHQHSDVTECHYSWSYEPSKATIKNDPTKELITFRREEMEKSYEHKKVISVNVIPKSK